MVALYKKRGLKRPVGQARAYMRGYSDAKKFNGDILNWNVAKVTNMDWVKPEDHDDIVSKFKMENNIKPPQNCSACHR